MISRITYIVLLLLLGVTLSSQTLHSDQWIYKSRKQIQATAIGPLGNVYLIKKESHTILTLLKLGKNRKREWTIKFNKETQQSSLKIKQLFVAPNQDIVMIGDCSNHFNIENKDTTITIGESNPNLFDKKIDFSFLLVLSPNGNVKWVKTLISEGNFMNVAVNSNGVVYATHMINKHVVKPSRHFALNHETASSYFLSIVKYSTSGELLNYLPLVQHSKSEPSVRIKFDVEDNLFLSSFSSSTKFGTIEHDGSETNNSSILAVAPNDSLVFYDVLTSCKLLNIEIVDSMVYVCGKFLSEGSFLKQISLKDKERDTRYLLFKLFWHQNQFPVNALISDHYKQIHLIYPFTNRSWGSTRYGLESIYHYREYLAFRDYVDYLSSSFDLERFNRLQSQKIFNSRVVEIKNANHANFSVHSLQSNGFHSLMKGRYTDSNTVSDIYGRRYSLYNPTKKSRYFLIKSKAKRITDKEDYYNEWKFNESQSSSNFALPLVFESPKMFSVSGQLTKEDQFYALNIKEGNGLFTVKLYSIRGGRELYNTSFYVNKSLSELISLYYIENGDYVLSIKHENEVQKLYFSLYEQRYSD